MCAALTIQGATGHIDKVFDLSAKGLQGKGSVALSANLVPGEPLDIVRSQILHTSQGGYVVRTHDEQQSLLGVGPGLSAPVAGSMAEEVYGPAAQAIVHATLTTASNPSVQEFFIARIPTPCDPATQWGSDIEYPPSYFATAGPPAIPIAATTNGFMIGVQGPIDVVDLIVAAPPGFEVRRHLILAGHFISLQGNFDFGKFLAGERTPERWHLTVRDHGSGSTVLDEDLPVDPSWPGFGTNNIFGSAPDGRFAEFHYARRLPSSFTFGHLSLQFQLTNIQFLYEAEVQLAPVDNLHLPIEINDQIFRDSTLHFGNGPAEQGDAANSHNGDMHQRYAYDLGRYVNGRDRRTDKNESLDDFYGFGDGVLAIADGTVINVVDQNPDLLPGDGQLDHMNRIDVRHDHADRPRYSSYAHVKQGSATHVVGDQVQAGEKLAEVGCNGASSGPHLHLAYYEFDDWGHLRMLPMAFTVADGAGGAISGVPQGGLRLNPPARESTTWAGRVAHQFWESIVAVVREVLRF